MAQNDRTAPADPVVAAYLKDVDRSLLRIEINIFGFDCHCVTLAKQIELKRAAGRPKDNEVLAELEALLADSYDGTDREGGGDPNGHRFGRPSQGR